jgi:hypothetical protein
MNPLFIPPLLQMGSSIINRLFPDPAEKAKAELELLKMTQDGDLKQVMAQLEINAKEAAHPSLFVAGGRPFFIWIGGVGFGYAVLLQPLLSWVASIKGWPVPPMPNIDLLWVVVSGLLGIGGMRTVEKIKGVASK